jgi:hypothetical protein
VADFQNGGNDKHQTHPSRSDPADARTYGQIIQQTLPSGLTDTQLTSSNIQLQSIPERILHLRPPNETEPHLLRHGLISHHQKHPSEFQQQLWTAFNLHPEQLYLSTITDGGIKNLTWDEFKGITISACGNGTTPYAPTERTIQRPTLTTHTQATERTATGSASSCVPTTGSILALGFGSTIQLSEDFYCGG